MPAVNIIQAVNRQYHGNVLRANGHKAAKGNGIANGLPVNGAKSNDCGCGWHGCTLCFPQSAVMKGTAQRPSAQSEVSCISLGSWCGVAQCLRGMQLRTEAMPFDWNRTSMDGILEFLENDFKDFLQFQGTKLFPWTSDGRYDPQNGSNAFVCKHHSFWHDDLEDPKQHEKYQRRIQRFMEISSHKLLFIRSVNCSAEVEKGFKLLQKLRGIFREAEVWLMLLVDHQSAAEAFVIDGTEGRLLVSLIDKRHLRTQVYYGDVVAYREAILNGLGYVLRRPLPGMTRNTPKSFESCSKLAAIIEPFYSGPTQAETWDPQPLLSGGVVVNPRPNPEKSALRHNSPSLKNGVGGYPTKQISPRSPQKPPVWLPSPASAGRKSSESPKRSPEFGPEGTSRANSAVPVGTEANGADVAATVLGRPMRISSSQCKVYYKTNQEVSDKTNEVSGQPKPKPSEATVQSTSMAKDPMPPFFVSQCRKHLDEAFDPSLTPLQSHWDPSLPV